MMFLKRKFLGVFFLPCLLTQALPAQRLPDPTLHELLSQGIDFTLRQQYEPADSLFKLISMQFPGHPAGYLYQAAVVESRSMDFVSEFHEERFDSLLGISLKLAEKMIEGEPASPWGYYFLATTLGYDAFTRANRGDWFGGLRKGLSSASEFKSCVAKDSTFYDAFAGLGTYYYWKSRKTEFLLWLPFISDDRVEGIRLLQQCSKLGTYNRYVALSALVTIFLDAGEFEKAEETARQALSQYPMNRVFLWGLGRALMNRGEYKDAVEVYGRILQSIGLEVTTNPLSEITCRLNIVNAKLALRDSLDVKVHLEAILGYESHTFPEEVRSRARAKFEEARQIQSLIRSHRASGN